MLVCIRHYSSTHGDLALGGLLKASAVLSTICALDALAFFSGLLGSVEQMSRSGFFGTQSFGFLLSVGLAAGFLISGAVVKALGRRTPPETNVEDSFPVPPEMEAA